MNNDLSGNQVNNNHGFSWQGKPW